MSQLLYSFDPLLIICTIILLIEIYNETFLMNYGSFSERFRYLFSLKMLFKNIKISSFVFAAYLFYLYNINEEVINYNFFESNIFNINSDKLYIYLIPISCYILFMILSNSIEILKQFSFDPFSNSRIVQFTACLSFIFYRIFAYFYTYIIFAIVFYFLSKLDLIFATKNLALFDWLENSSKLNTNYNTGVYSSLVITLLFFFLFNNAFIKIKSSEIEYRQLDGSYFGYLFISVILAIGIFFGFFSIFNAFHNIQASSLTEWFSKENVLGILPIRIASIFILFNLFSYIYSETLERKIIPFFILAIFPIRNIESYHLSINIEKRESLYFSQISFYIINIAVAEYFLIIGLSNVFVSILYFAILFIQDDFKIINEYSEGLQSVLRSHLRRIHIINILMLVSGIIGLIYTESFVVLIAYIILTTILAFLYFYNFSFVYNRDYKF